MQQEQTHIFWQALFFIISMLCFTFFKVLILAKVVGDLYTFWLLRNISLILIDYGPAIYMVNCHRRMFRRSFMQFNDEDKQQFSPMMLSYAGKERK